MLVIEKENETFKKKGLIFSMMANFTNSMVGQRIQIFGKTLFQMLLGRYFLDGITFKLVGWLKHITLHNVGWSHLITKGLNRKDWPPHKEEILAYPPTIHTHTHAHTHTHIYICVLGHFSHVQLCATLLDSSPPGFSVHGILQARIWK